MRFILTALSATVLWSSNAFAVPVQWSGNGHYYDYIPVVETWTAAKADAQSRSFQGVQGYLTTVTSAAEKEFLRVQYTPPGQDTYKAWLGGYQDRTALDYSEPAGGWRWVSGEPWSYTNWWVEVGLPDNSGGQQDYLRSQGQFMWDDLQNAPGIDSPPLIEGFFVEYPVPEPTSTGVAAVSLGMVVLLRRRRRPGTSPA